jgi:hypothetical protein
MQLIKFGIVNFLNRTFNIPEIIGINGLTGPMNFSNIIIVELCV